MGRAHFRPRVVLLSRASPDEVREKLKQRVAASSHLEGRAASGQVLAWMAPEVRKPWSPCLDLNLRPHPEGTLVTGVFCPHPARMTLYMFAGIGVAFLTAIALTWSFVQVTLDEAPTCLVAVGVAATAVALFSIGGRVGRRWAVPQMHELSELLDGLGEMQENEVERLAEVEALRQARLHRA